MKTINRIQPISGVGDKAAACILLDYDGKRILLDLGEGPAPGQLPDMGDVDHVDALIISHTHRDHIGGFPLLPRLGNPPVFATAGAFSLMASSAEHAFQQGGILPANGTADVIGISVTTGRSGHAPGGVWVHLDVAGGVLYCGDICLESPLYVYDPPPPARVVILDASYGLDDTPQAERIAALTPFFNGDGLLLPIPPDGRGPDIAVYLAKHERTLPALDPATREMIKNLLAENRPYAHDGVIPVLEKLAAEAPSVNGGNPKIVTIAASGSAISGTSAELTARWENDENPAIVFTGFMPPGSPARRLVEMGRAHFLRWNVHPRHADNVALVRETGAEIVLPAFCDAVDNETGWRRDFAPADLCLKGPVAL